MDSHEIDLRGRMATELDGVWKHLNAMLELWFVHDLDSDFLREDEYPFTESLEDLVAHVNDATEKIRERNDWASRRPVTIYVSREEYEQLLRELDEPPKALPKLKKLLESAQHPDWMD